MVAMIDFFSCFKGMFLKFSINNHFYVPFFKDFKKFDPKKYTFKTQALSKNQEVA